jgi:predicted metal-binding protein
MTKIGIIRCQESAMSPDMKDRCAGWGCLAEARKRTAYFDEYDEVELIGFDTCGGCPGKGNTKKITDIGKNFKEHGVEVIHLSSCIAGFCPNKNLFIKALSDETGLPIRERTHGMPDGKRFPVGPDGKPLMPEELYAKLKEQEQEQKP